MKQGHFQMEVGRLLWNHLREMLDSEIFLGANIQYQEGKGFFERTFTVKGDITDVNRVYNRVDTWMKGMGK